MNMVRVFTHMCNIYSGKYFSNKYAVFSNNIILQERGVVFRYFPEGVLSGVFKKHAPLFKLFSLL